MTPEVLIAGIGNVFLGDDGFGVAVARRLDEAELPAGVVAADYGIRGMHLAYDMLDNNYPATILVDAVPRGGEPGTLYVIEADLSTSDTVEVNAHSMTPDAVLALLRRLGGEPGRVFVVGCEPATVAEGIGLSPPVAATVDQAARRVRELACELARLPAAAGEE